MIKADTRKLKVNYFNLLTIGGWGGGAEEEVNIQ